MRSHYTIIKNLILRASKKVNGGHAAAVGDAIFNSSAAPFASSYWSKRAAT
jgi:hypothetical protein